MQYGNDLLDVAGLRPVQARAKGSRRGWHGGGDGGYNCEIRAIAIPAVRGIGGKTGFCYLH